MTSHTAEPDEEILDRYLARTAEPAQVAQVERYARQHPEWRSALSVMQAWVQEPEIPDPPSIDPSVRTMHTRIQERSSSRIAVQHRRVSMGWVAAAVLVGFTGFWAIRHAGTSVRDLPAEMREHRTAAGERARVVLPDYSTVLLAPGSVIRYRADFSTTSSRTVELEGHALFTVTHATGAPFTIQTSNVTTRVLGTTFSVRRYAQDTATRVVVAHGRVAVGASVLGTGDIATATDDARVLATRENAVASELAWTEGRLIFSGARLREVIPELERWYGMTIVASDSAVLDRRVMTTFDTETPAEVMQVIATAVDGRVQIKGMQFTIYSSRKGVR